MITIVVVKHNVHNSSNSLKVGVHVCQMIVSYITSYLYGAQLIYIYDIEITTLFAQ